MNVGYSSLIIGNINHEKTGNNKSIAYLSSKKIIEEYIVLNN